jgi:hypothetical protein
VPSDRAKAGDNAYYSALGRFVHTFAQAELALFLLLRHYAKMTLPAARALLTGIRADSVQSLLKRLHEIDFIDGQDWANLNETLQHLSIINKLRNDLLHHTTMLGENGRGVVTNAAKALHPDRVTQSMVSPQILDGATLDLRKIIISLHVNHMGKADPWRGEADAILHAPWRYKPLSSPPKKSPKRKS